MRLATGGRMKRVTIRRAGMLFLGLLSIGSGSCGQAVGRNDEVETIRVTERARLKALVEADMPIARELHAAGFQLVTPGGQTFSKEQYLGDIQSGAVDYLVWEPDSTIQVRPFRDAAVIRYRSRLEIVVGGEKIPLQKYWHTDSYEKLNGRWQVVWSQATRITD